MNINRLQELTGGLRDCYQLLARELEDMARFLEQLSAATETG